MSEETVWQGLAAILPIFHWTSFGVKPLLQLVPDWRARFLTRVIREEDLKLLRAHEHTGRPLGDEAFLASLEQNLGRI